MIPCLHVCIGNTLPPQPISQMLFPIFPRVWFRDYVGIVLSINLDQVHQLSWEDGYCTLTVLDHRQ